jgi:hypothetical protein
MNHGRIVAPLAYGIIVLLSISGYGSVRAQPDRICFTDTGFCIAGRIRSFWEQNGGLPVFGFPIGPQQEELIEGQPFQVQWFQRNRLELHPEKAQPYDVLLGLLGADRLVQQKRESFPKNEALSGCRYFTLTGHNVCGDILASWSANGLEFDGFEGKSEAENLALFGYPLSDPQSEIIDGKSYTIQWFERARFEMHAENAPPYNVLLGLLGKEVLSGKGSQPATPTPTRTTTPTLTPTATPTLTPTSGDASGIASQLDFGNPGPPICGITLKLLNEPPAKLLIDPSAKPHALPIDKQFEVAEPFWICLDGFDNTKRITVQVLRPDDTALPVTKEGPGWKVIVPPGEQLGKYQIIAKQDQKQLKSAFVIIRAKTPKLIVYPQSGVRGITFKIGLAGYQNDPDKTVPLHLYRFTHSSSGVISAERVLPDPPAGRIDENGEAVVKLVMNRNALVAKYIVVAEPIRHLYNPILDPGIFTLNR